MEIKQMTINELTKDIHESAIKNGWYDHPRTFGELISLIHSEASEALEEYRNGNKPNESYYNELATVTDDNNNVLHKLEGIPSELADIIIRVLDMCGFYGIDIEKTIEEKRYYNQFRGYRHGNKVL
jgi:NTP pyrophosphatase (non-canonical NTP hydrolase)